MSLAATLPIAFSPVYLIARGFFSKNSLNQFDYEIYLLVFYLTLVLLIQQARGNSVTNLLKFHSQNFKELIAGSGTFLVLLIINIFLASKSAGDLVAWVSSGDNRNHVVLGSEIANIGWLDFKTFLYQPISVGAITGLMYGQFELNTINVNELLEFNLKIYAILWTFILGILGWIFSATCREFFSKRNQEIPKFSSLFVASLVPLSSLISSTPIYDGFISATFSIALVALIILWFLRIGKIEKIVSFEFVLGLIIFIGSIFAWSFVGFFTFPIILVASWLIIRKKFNSPYKVDLLYWIFSFFIVFSLNQSSFVQTIIYKAKIAFSATGAISTVRPEFLYALFGIVILLSVFSNKELIPTNKNIRILVVTVFLSFLVFKWFGNLALFEWNYYSLKIMWIMISALLCLVTALVVNYVDVLFMSFNHSKINNLKFKQTTYLILIYLTFYLISETITPIKQTWIKVLQGWENPNSQTMNKIFSTSIDYKTPTLLFRYGYNGESMLGNFWLNAYTVPIEPIRGWNYTIDTLGDEKQLCDVSGYYDAVRVITYDINLETELKKLCPEGKFLISVESQVS